MKIEVHNQLKKPVAVTVDVAYRGVVDGMHFEDLEPYKVRIYIFEGEEQNGG